MCVTATDGGPSEKAVLFCPRCRYSAPWDGDWEQTAEPHRVRCPACGETIG